MRCDAAEFRALPLEAHALLAQVPLRDVSAVDLPGGGAGRTISDVRALLPRGIGGEGDLLTRALFAIRFGLGRALGWDHPASTAGGCEGSYLERLPPELASRSLVPPGQADGAFQVLYVLDREALVEVRNATVHAFLASVLEPRPEGYRLYWAVYVQPVSWLTPLYMAVIEPFRRFVVYPSLLRQLRSRWRARYAS